MAENTTVSKLRFPEFEDAWVDSTIDEIADFRRGTFPQPYGLKKWYDDENGFPFIQVYDVGDDLRLKERTKRQISDLAKAQSVLVPKGSIVLTIQGSIGRIAVTQYDACCDRTLLIFTGFKVPIAEMYFVYALFLRFEIEKRIAVGGTIKTITKEKLRVFPIPLPTLPEQRKIADFLTAVDGRIGQLIQKKAWLTDYKKGVMQQLFTQAIRFKDDHGNDFPDWEENEFEMIAEKSKAKHNPTKSEEEWPCVELESLTQNTGKLLEIFSSSEQKSIKNKFVAGEVLFGKLRPYLRKYFHADFEGVCSSEIWVLRGKTVKNEYLFQLIQTHKFNQAANVSSGSKMPRSDWDFLSSIPFSHPSSPDEQTKIADYLSAIDRKVENVATQITETQTFKRGLLQQMFV